MIVIYIASHTGMFISFNDIILYVVTIVSNIIYLFLLSFTNCSYHLRFPVTGYHFRYNKPLPLCSNTQHKVRVTCLDRQYTLYFYHILEALEQAMTDAAFCFDSAAQ